jgi:hypothetical protein
MKGFGEAVGRFGVVFVAGLFLAGCVPTYEYEPLTLTSLDKGQSRSVAILADAAWRNTGIQMHQGEVYRAVTLGTWSPGGLCGEVTADGLPVEHLLCMKGLFAANFPLPSGKIGALVGRIGLDGKVFDVNSANGFIADQGGILFLRMNDPDNLSFDNIGHIDVAIQRYAEGVELPVVQATQISEPKKSAQKKASSSPSKRKVSRPTGTPQELVKRGLSAAQSGDYNLAVNTLASAVTQTGPNPVNVFNLALAQSKAGNSLAAAAWLRVYLAMAPNAPNAAQIRSEVRTLDTKVSQTINILLEQAYAIALSLPEIRHSNEYREPKKLASIKIVMQSATQYGASELLSRAEADYKNIANRLGYKGSLNTAPFDVRMQMTQAEEVGDIRRLKELWGQEPYADALDFALSSLGELSAKAAVEEYRNLPEDMRRATLERLHYVVPKLLDEGNVELAEAFQKDMPFGSDRKIAAYYLAEHHLREGNLKAARAWANKCSSYEQESVRGICKTILGESKPVMAYYTSGAERPCDLCTSFDFKLAYLTPQLIQLGEIETAQRAADYARTLAAKAKYDDQREMAKLAQAYVDLAKGHVDAAFRFGKSTEPQSTVRNLFVQESIAITIAAGKIKMTEQLIKTFVLLKDKAADLRRLAVLAVDSGDEQTGTRLSREADAAEMQSRGGWSPTNTEQLDRVLRWYHQASTLQENVFTGYLDEAIQTAKEAKGEDVIYKLMYVAQQWHKHQGRMRVLEHYAPVLKEEE